MESHFSPAVNTVGFTILSKFFIIRSYSTAYWFRMSISDCDSTRILTLTPNTHLNSLLSPDATLFM